MNNNNKFEGNTSLSLAQSEDDETLLELIKEIMTEFEIGCYNTNDLDDISETYNHEERNFFYKLTTIDGDESEKIIGCVAIQNLNDNEESCELKRLYLLPEYRKKGYGKKMMNFILEVSKNNNYKRIWLQTSKKFSQAIRLYEKYGFTEIEDNRPSTCSSSCNLKYNLYL
eukprot:TRINITY_DN1078_c0_g1_i1.p1 TRINITY_DN1078_c0_g1~~TRINITY_DN1078_c0_g1_i1.p1  ORF type:complete len:170 (-),score=36.61 TRINITY_DN1078_c0_g1_i1:286-795(-)